MHITRLLIDSGVEGRDALVASVSLSCSLDEVLFGMVEQASHLDRLVQPYLIELLLGDLAVWYLLRGETLRFLPKLGGTLRNQILLPLLPFELPPIRPPRLVHHWDRDGREDRLFHLLP